jgi:2,5-furandicarboxylate decarboxylase 1
MSPNRPSLRSFLKELAQRSPASIEIVDRTLDPHHELFGYVKGRESGDCPVIVAPQSPDGPVAAIVVGVCATRERLAMAMGVEPAASLDAFDTRVSSPGDVALVSNAPAQHTVRTGADVDLGQLPIGTHVIGQGGPFLTAAIGVARDPSGAHNLGIYRMMVHGRRCLSVSATPGSHLDQLIERARVEGRRLPFAAAIGNHPALMLAAQARNPLQVDTFAVASALVEQPIGVAPAVTVPLHVPADAEVVIEGEIDPGRALSDGPFGEFSGYLFGGPAWAFEVSAITTRERALYQDLHSVHREHLCLFNHPGRELRLRSSLREGGWRVEDLHLPDDTAGMYAYLAVSEDSREQAADIARHALGADSVLKIAVIVDDDVDIRDHAEILWAIATRARPEHDIVMLPEQPVTRFDPSADGHKRAGKLLIDATVPAIAHFPRRARSAAVEATPVGDALPTDQLGTYIDE